MWRTTVWLTFLVNYETSLKEYDRLIMKNKTLTFDEIIQTLLEEDKDINWNNITEVYTRNLPNKKMTSVNLRLIFNDKLDVVPVLKEEQRF